MAEAISVSEFVAASKQQIEQQARAQWISGEVANFTAAASGHWYFSLRDAHSQLDCVMLARHNRLADATPKSGDNIAVFGSAALYAPRGRFQLAVQLLQFDGAGQLYRLFLQRKEQWRARGWFERQRPLPQLPQTVGIVCSTKGAALHDVLRTFNQRYALLRVIVYPAPAQGEGAAEKIAAMINTAGARGECDVLLVIRGGGGIEDLWAYNEEAVVAAIAACPIAVISGIGHETDEVLADYAADCRCATPTAAAAAAVPAAAELVSTINTHTQRLTEKLQAAVDDGAQRIDWVLRLLRLPHTIRTEKKRQLQLAAAALQTACHKRLTVIENALPAADVLQRAAYTCAAQKQRLLPAAATLQRAYRNYHKTRLAALQQRQQALELLSPQKLLQRGYSIVSNSSGEIVRSVKTISDGEAINIQLADGTLPAVAKSK